VRAHGVCCSDDGGTGMRGDGAWGGLRGGDNI
jgi:hypothetical protein